MVALPQNRIGLFGGSYNPMHLGHLGAACEVQEILHLSRVLLLPARCSPFKSREEMLPDALRAKVIALTIASYPTIELCDIEFHLPTPSYTINTVRALIERGTIGTAIPTLIMGIETFQHIERWRQIHELLQLVDLVVHTRPGGPDPLPTISLIASRFGLCYNQKSNGQCPLQEAYDKHAEPHPTSLPVAPSPNTPLLLPKSSADTIYNTTGGAGSYPCMLGTFSHPSGRQLFAVAVTPFDISSSDIRARMKRGESIRGLVADAALSTLMEESNIHEAESRSSPSPGRRKRR